MKEQYSNDQKDTMLIAAFLDPICFAILNELEIEKAKKLILKKQNYFELDESTIRNKKIKKTETFHRNFASLCIKDGYWVYYGKLISSKSNLYGIYSFLNGIPNYFLVCYGLRLL